MTPTSIADSRFADNIFFSFFCRAVIISPGINRFDAEVITLVPVYDFFFLVLEDLPKKKKKSICLINS